MLALMGLMALLCMVYLLDHHSASLLHWQAEERDIGPTAERVESRAGCAARREGRRKAGTQWQPRRGQQCGECCSWWQIACRNHGQARVTGRWLI